MPGGYGPPLLTPLWLDSRVHSAYALYSHKMRCGPHSPQPSFREEGLAVPDLSLADMRNPRAEKGSRSRQSTPARPMPHDPKRQKPWGFHPTRHNGSSISAGGTPRAPTVDPAGWQARPETTISISEGITDGVQLPGSQRPTNCTILLVFPSRKTRY